MSTKTTFKRIALVAAASLGFSIIAAIPSQAQVLTSVTLAGTAGSADTATSDSSGAATASVTFLSSGPTDFHGDSVAVTASLKQGPTGSTSIQPTLMLVDTGSAATGYSTVDTDTTRSAVSTVAARYMNPLESVNVGNVSFNQVFITKYDTSVVGQARANFKIYLDTNSGGGNITLTAGTYVVSLQATPYNDGVVDYTNTKTLDVNIVVSAVASASTTASAATSTAYIGATRAAALAATTDSVVTALSTASTTLRASIYVNLKNAASGQASESITITQLLLVL